MAFEWHDTTTVLHRLGKDMVTTAGNWAESKEKLYRPAVTPEEHPIIPALEIFDMDDTKLDAEAAKLSIPQPSECAIHLELLETFYVLRQRILTSEAIDRAVGIKPERTTKTGKKGDKKTFKDATLLERRQVKWEKFVEFAVIRFLDWHAKFEYFRGINSGIGDENLPPLDVIMVWHSFLLNPALFRKHCWNGPIYAVKLPWESIHRHINNEDWTFTLGSSAAKRYEEFSELKPDLFVEFETWCEGRTTSKSKTWPQIDTFGIGVATSTQHLSRSSTPTRYARLFKASDSRLAKQLRDAVIRQASFVDKMSARLWIRSPALAGTLRRGVDRYLQFCELLKLSKSVMLVPTLDVDLAWHTHQCAAKGYALGIWALTGRFVDHDDKLGKGVLGDGFGDTRRLFRIRYGKEYDNCGCWDCEALLSELETAMNSPEPDLDMASITAKVKKQVAYYRAVEVARRNEQPIPILDS